MTGLLIGIGVPLAGAWATPANMVRVVRRAAEHEMLVPIIQTVARAVEIIRKDFAGAVVLSFCIHLATADRKGFTTRLTVSMLGAFAVLALASLAALAVP